MLRMIVFAVLLCLSLSCLSADGPPKIDGWKLLTTSDYEFVYSKNDSAYVHQGVRYILIQAIPTSSSSNSTVIHFKLGISDADCRNESGSIIFYSVKGKFLLEKDYVKGGDDVGNTIASFLCSLEISE